MFDRAVLAGGIHRLEDQEQRPAVLGIEFLLHVTEKLDAFFEESLRLALVFQAVGVGGIVVLQPEFSTIGHAAGIDDARSFFQQLAVFHSPGSVVQTRPAEQRAKRRTKSGG